MRTASLCGCVNMLALLFSSNYPGPEAVFWHYFGAALDHLALALCFAAFALGRRAEQTASQAPGFNRYRQVLSLTPRKR